MCASRNTATTNARLRARAAPAIASATASSRDERHRAREHLQVIGRRRVASHWPAVHHEGEAEVQHGGLEPFAPGESVQRTQRERPCGHHDHTVNQGTPAPFSEPYRQQRQTEDRVVQADDGRQAQQRRADDPIAARCVRRQCERQAQDDRQRGDGFRQRLRSEVHRRSGKREDRGAACRIDRIGAEATPQEYPDHAVATAMAHIANLTASRY